MTDELRGGGATPGALHIVSTPIGNLADLSPRATVVLREVGLIVAEDTRVSRPLLASIGVQTEVTALPGFDETDRVAPIIARLQAGTAVALISDAGTPLISDPGERSLPPQSVQASALFQSLVHPHFLRQLLQQALQDRAGHLRASFRAAKLTRPRCLVR